MAPGAGVAIWDADSVEISVAGLRKADGAPITERDLWHIGSNTKAMTAALTARLVEDGTLSWDDTIGGLLGEAITVHPSYADVTLEELLSHRSGLPANEPMWRSFKALFFPSSEPLPQQRLRYAAAILRQPMAGRRGAFLLQRRISDCRSDDRSPQRSKLGRGDARGGLLPLWA